MIHGAEVEVELTHDDEGLVYDVFFIEENNKKVEVAGSSIFLTTIEGDEEQITILEPKKLVR
jgi:uncharacterized membrane protein YkoI